MSLYRLIPLSCVLTLTACQYMEKKFENYHMPTGYTHLDTTPISTPHGYNKTWAQEEVARDKIATHADGWKGAVLNALTPISSVLDMSQPVAVMAAPPLTPLNSAAANYAREVMIGMNYLVALPTDTTQIVRVDGNRLGKESDEMVQFTLSIERDGIVYASRTIDVKMKPQEAEESLLPLWTSLESPVITPDMSMTLSEPRTFEPVQLTPPVGITPAPLSALQTTSVMPEEPVKLPRGRAVPLYGQ